MKSTLLWSAGSVLVLILAVFGWQMLSDAQILPRAFLPGPDRTWLSLTKGFASGLWSEALGTTLRRMGIGWALASLIGIALGTLIGLSSQVRAYVAPMLELLRPLPASALAPVAILIFGLSDGMILALVAFGAVWPMLLTTIHGVSHVHARKVEVAQSLGMSRLSYATKIALPAALPDILGGLRLGLTVALILVVVGEMITVQGGIGAEIMVAARRFNAGNIFAGIVLLGLMGLTTNALLTAVEARLLRWQHR